VGLRALDPHSEGFSRKRFTLAPDRGSEAVVEDVLPVPGLRGKRRFQRRVRRAPATAS